MLRLDSSAPRVTQPNSDWNRFHKRPEISSRCGRASAAQVGARHRAGVQPTRCAAQAVEAPEYLHQKKSMGVERLRARLARFSEPCRGFAALGPTGGPWWTARTCAPNSAEGTCERTEERVANVECVRCGTRTEIANEASDGLARPVCAGCGEALQASGTSEDAALNGIFTGFAHGAQLLPGEGQPSEPTLDGSLSGDRALNGDAAAPAAARSADTRVSEVETAPVAVAPRVAESSDGASALSVEAAFAGDVTAPETPSAIAAAEVESPPPAPVLRSPTTWTKTPDAWAEAPETVRYLMIPSVAALDEAAGTTQASDVAPPSEHFGELASSSERAVESSPLAAPAPSPAFEAVRASLVDSGWSTPTAASEPFVEPAPSFAVDASERAGEEPAASEGPPSSTAEGAARLSKGPPPPPAWAFSPDDDESPLPPEVQAEAPASSRVEHPSFADDDAVDSHSDIALPLVVAAPASHHKPEAEVRVPSSSSLPAATKSSGTASEAPVVSSLLAPPQSNSVPLWGDPGSKRRAQVMTGLAGLAVIASFFLGRSSVSPVRNERVSAAKAEAPRPIVEAPVVAPPSQLAPAPQPSSVPPTESSVASAPAPTSAGRPGAAPDPGSPLMVVTTTKGHAPALASAVPSGSLDLAAADDAIVDAAARASSCRRPEQPQKRATVTVTFAPSGRVASANIAGIRFAGVGLRNCMGATFLGARVPAFNGPSVTVRKSLKM